MQGDTTAACDPAPADQPRVRVRDMDLDQYHRRALLAAAGLRRWGALPTLWPPAANDVHEADEQWLMTVTLAYIGAYGEAPALQVAA